MSGRVKTRSRSSGAPHAVNAVRAHAYPNTGHDVAAKHDVVDPSRTIEVELGAHDPASTPPSQPNMLSSRQLPAGRATEPPDA